MRLIEGKEWLITLTKRIEHLHFDLSSAQHTHLVEWFAALEVAVALTGCAFADSQCCSCCFCFDFLVFVVVEVDVIDGAGGACTGSGGFKEGGSGEGNAVTEGGGGGDRGGGGG